MRNTGTRITRVERINTDFYSASQNKDGIVPNSLAWIISDNSKNNEYRTGNNE